MSLREKIEGLTRYHSFKWGYVWLCSEVLAAVEEWEAEHKILLNPNRFDCPECGQGVAADEDGCCATCGRDCDAYEDGVRVVTAERDEDEPAPTVGQAGGVQEPADEFRPGLPTEAMRRHCLDWDMRDRHSGHIYRTRITGLTYCCNHWVDKNQREPLSAYDWTQHDFRPRGSTWSAVELLAAKALGEEDGKAGREMLPVRQRALALGYDLSRRPIDGRLLGAYREAYLAAKGTT